MASSVEIQQLLLQTLSNIHLDLMIHTPARPSGHDTTHCIRQAEGADNPATTLSIVPTDPSGSVKNLPCNTPYGTRMLRLYNLSSILLLHYLGHWSDTPTTVHPESAAHTQNMLAAKHTSTAESWEQTGHAQSLMGSQCGNHQSWKAPDAANSRAAPL